MQEGLRRRAAAPVRPYTLRVHRDHGGGLWTFEGDDGQLYLAVLSREFRRPNAHGREYFWPTEAERARPEADPFCPELRNSA